MHVKYLGTDQYLFGSILELLVSWVLDGSPEENLKRVWASLQEAYNSLRTPVQQRYRYLNRLTMFMRSGYAKLRGKASEIRHLGKALQIMWLKFYNKRLGVHRDIALILKLNCAMESIIEDNRAVSMHSRPKLPHVFVPPATACSSYFPKPPNTSQKMDSSSLILQVKTTYFNTWAYLLVGSRQDPCR